MLVTGRIHAYNWVMFRNPWRINSSASYSVFCRGIVKRIPANCQVRVAHNSHQDIWKLNGETWPFCLFRCLSTKIKPSFPRSHGDCNWRVTVNSSHGITALWAEKGKLTDWRIRRYFSLSTQPFISTGFYQEQFILANVAIHGFCTSSSSAVPSTPWKRISAVFTDGRFLTQNYQGHK